MKRVRSDFEAAYSPATPTIQPTPPDARAIDKVPDLSLGPSAMDFCSAGGDTFCQRAGELLGMQEQIAANLSELRRRVELDAERFHVHMEAVLHGNGFAQRALDGHGAAAAAAAQSPRLLLK